MGRKNTIPNYPMFGAAGANMATASTTSSISNVENTDNVGIILNWSGTSPVGTLTVDCCNDYDTQAPTAAHWVSLDFGSAISISGNTGSHLISINQVPYTYMRVVYTKVSGVGTLFANISSKQTGG